MLRASLVFFIFAIFAMLLGAYGFAGVSMDIGKILLGIFIVLAAISFIGGMINRRSPQSLT